MENSESTELTINGGSTENGGNSMQNFEIENGSANDDGGGAHSLPTPDELKIDRPNSTFTCHRVLFIVIIAAVVAAVVGLSFGLTGDDGKDNGNDNDVIVGGGEQAPNTKDRRLQLAKYFINEGVTAEDVFQVPGTAQSRAIEFLADVDQLKLDVPKGGINTPEGYRLLIRYVMTVFFYATNGPRWNFNLLFLSNRDTCDWFYVFDPPVGQTGVLCNQNTKELLGISFIFNKLSGSIPDEIGFLTTLEYVESIGNDLRGPIPNTFSKLTNLDTIIFPYNLLTGKVPPFIGSFTNLAFLYLSNNLMTGSIPTEIKRLTKLTVLGVDDNAFVGPGDFIFDYPLLRYAYADRNALHGLLPVSITETSPRLIHLDISENEFDGPLPADLFRLTDLEVLDVHDNDFTGEIPSDINLQTTLRFVSLHSNALEGDVPISIGNLHALEHLDLSQNVLSGIIPTEWDELTNLRFFFLSENPFLSGPIPSFVFRLTNLRELSLKGTSRTGSIPEIEALLTDLILLDLDDNMLTGTIPSILGTMEKLQFLLLNRNELTGTFPTEIGNLDNLRLILVDRNNVTGTMDNVCDVLTEEAIAIADCNELTCMCCEPCCEDSVPECHDNDVVANANLNWETGFQREFFQFSNTGDLFEVNDSPP